MGSNVWVKPENKYTFNSSIVWTLTCPSENSKAIINVTTVHFLLSHIKMYAVNKMVYSNYNYKLMTNSKWPTNWSSVPGDPAEGAPISAWPIDLVISLNRYLQMNAEWKIFASEAFWFPFVVQVVVVVWVGFGCNSLF